MKIMINRVTFNRIFRYLIIGIVVFIGGEDIKALDWNYDNKYDSRKLFLHAFTNYDINSSWKYHLEKNYLKKNYTRASFGSITTKELLSDFQIHINQKLGKGWYFQENFYWYASHHRDQEEKSNYMGLEKNIYKQFSIYLHLNPAFDKEFVDGRLGIAIASSDREEYLRLAYVWEDIFYESKNALEGRTVQHPLGLNWKLRKNIGNWCIYSTGEYSTGFIREYPEESASPHIKKHEQQSWDYKLKTYNLLNNWSLLEFSFYYYRYFDKKNFWQQENDYTYDNEILRSRLKYLVDINSNLSLHSGIQYVDQKAEARGYKNYNYDREEIFLPDIGIKYDLNSGSIELSYFGSFYEWDLNNFTDNVQGYKSDGYVDKVKLGYTHRFKNRSKLQFSISHVIMLQGFGGANAQYVIYF